MRRGGRTGLVTVVFTDIVGSSAIASEMGDEAWSRLLEQHHRRVREALRRSGGREMDTAGDGFFVAFERPGDAIGCVWKVREELREIGLEIRAGVHVGEAEALDQKVGGTTVNVGARVMSLAGPGEVLVTGTVRELVAGRKVAFTERGSHQLKGIPGDWSVFAVSEVDGAGPGTVVGEEEGARRRRAAAEPPASRRQRIPVAAIVGLSLAVVVIGAVVVSMAGDDAGERTGDRPSTTASRPSPSDEAEAFPTEAEASLLRNVPPGFAQSCVRAATLPTGSSAAVDCVDGDHRVTYASFERVEEMDAAFEAIGEEQGTGPGDCGVQVEAEGSYPGGRVLCYRGTAGYLPSSFIAWTDPERRILAMASRSDLADLALYRWWAIEGGPADPGDQAPVKEVDVTPPLGGRWSMEVTPADAGTFDYPFRGQETFVGTWTLSFDQGTLRATQEPEREIPFVQSYGFGKLRRLVFTHYDQHSPDDCDPTLSFTWTVDAGVLTFTDQQGGCSFDVFTSLLTYKPWQRVS